MLIYLVYYMILLFFSVMGDFCLFTLMLSFVFFFVLALGPSLISSFMVVDLLSWSLILLLTFLFLVMIIGSLNLLWGDLSSRFFFFLMGTLVLFLYVCFLVSSYLFFYLSFECSVVPIFMIIVGWGYSYERLQAGMYLFVYTLSLSLPFLFFLVSLYINDCMGDWMNSFFYYSYEVGLMWALMSVMVFLIKFPLYGFHLWLPKAHVEAPLSGSMVLAGVLLKLGAYGFFRFYIYFVVINSIKFWLYWMGLVGSFISMLMCFRQVDMKCMVAYMSVSHMSLMIGVFMGLGFYSMIGFIMMMISHGFSSSGLFSLLGVCYSRLHTRSLMMMKSNFFYVSVLGMWGFMIMLSGMSCPPTLNFFSEIFLVWGMFSHGGYMSFIVFCLYFLAGSISLVHFFIVLFHGKFNMTIFSYPLLLTESLLLFMHVTPVMIGFLLI